MLLRLTAPDADRLAQVLSWALQETHEATCEAERAPEREEAAELLGTVRRTLEQLDPENPLLRVRLRPGVPAPWDDIHDAIAQLEEEDEDAEEGDDEPEADEADAPPPEAEAPAGPTAAEPAAAPTP